MARWTARVLWAVVAVLFGAGALGALVVSPGHGGGRPVTGTSPSPRPRPTTTSTVVGPASTVVPSLVAFVEAERGLRFVRPPRVEVVTERRFAALLGETEEEDLAGLRDTIAVLGALGLADRDIDLPALQDSLSAGILGFYDLDTRELFVRGDSFTPFVRTVVVHELTHALEDQHFELDPPDLGDEAYLGLQGLVEGSATAVEESYRRTALTPAEQRQADREEDDALRGAPPLPRAVEALFAFPYEYGPGLVAALRRAGGQRRLDQAYADPPASTEQVIDPDRYLAGDDPRPVAEPSADRRPFDDGEVGQLFLALMLDAELGQRDAVRAARGWAGGHYVAWREGVRTCLRADFAMDTPQDTAELADALGRWAAARGAVASATGTSVRTCG